MSYRSTVLEGKIYDISNCLGLEGKIGDNQ